MPPDDNANFNAIDPFLIDGHKIDYHPQRVALWLTKPSEVFPIYVEVSPVGQCNHRCTFCAVDYIGYVNRRLEPTRFQEVLDDMARSGIRSIMYAGEGEPMLHPEINRLVYDTARAGIDMAFTTNGTRLDERFVEESLDKVKWIKVSINAGDRETYAKIHQTKERDWERVWGNLRNAISGRGNRRVSSKVSTVIGAQTVVLPDNIKSLEGLIQKSVDVGLDYCVLKPYSQHKMSITKTYEEVRYDDQIKELGGLAEKYSTEKFKVVCRSHAMQTAGEAQPYHKCQATPYFWAYIMADGEVYGCSAYLLDKRFRYGNINDKLFSEIWLGAERRESIRYVNEELDITECRKNCRMDKVNRYLWGLKNPNPHVNFI